MHERGGHYARVSRHHGQLFVFLIFTGGECTIDVFDEEDGLFRDGGGGIFKERIIHAGKEQIDYRWSKRRAAGLTTLRLVRESIFRDRVLPPNGDSALDETVIDMDLTRAYMVEPGIRRL